jgi:diguanylate cyclase (GGDEF)-like protein
MAVAYVRAGLEGMSGERRDPLGPAGWEDPLTGAQGPAFWWHLLPTELARSRRYRRPLTIVLVDLTGADVLARTWGFDVAGEAVAALGRFLRSSVRTSDHVTRVAPFLFGLVLTETGEVAAINLVERIRDGCAAALPDPVRSELRPSFGWASPKAEEELDALLHRAEKLLEEERRG